AARPSGDLGGLARGLPPDPAVQVVELARQLRRRGLAGPEVGRHNNRSSRSSPKTRGRGELRKALRRRSLTQRAQPALFTQKLRECFRTVRGALPGGDRRTGISRPRKRKTTTKHMTG